MQRTSGRVVLPRSPKEKIELAEVINAKHSLMGAASPLNAIDGIDITGILSSSEEVMDLHNLAENFKRQMEQTYRQRDVKLEPLVDAMKKGIHLLKATYVANPKKLGEWGINIDDSKHKKADDKA